jgi:hypothetical protein
MRRPGRADVKHWLQKKTVLTGEVSPVATSSEEEEGSGPVEPDRSQSPETAGSQPSTQPLPRPDGQAAQGQLDEIGQEVQRQREELALLHKQLDTRGRRQRRITMWRQIVAALLAFLAALGVTASVVGLWAGNTTLNTDRWVATVTPLSQDPAVRAAVATYSTEQIFTTLNVEQRVKEALPPRAAFLASPLTGAVHGYVQDAVNKVVASPQFAALWPPINRVAHQQAMNILNNNSAVVRNSGQTVTLNLLPVVNQVLNRLEQQIPSLFGKTVTLPTLTNGQIPPGLRAKIESALGVTLPANFAAIPIYQGNQLSAAQQTVVQVKRGLTLLVIGTLLALGLALWISTRRRRTTLQFGIWLIIDVVALTSVLRAVRTQLIDQVPAGVYRAGVDAGVQVVFVTLRERGTQLLWLGIVIALVAYLVGPGRAAVALRSWAVRAWHFVSEKARRFGSVAVAEGPDFARAHLDPLRIGGLVVAGILLIFFTSWAGLFWILVLLGLYELLVTVVAAAGHGPAAGEASPQASEQGRTSQSTGLTA